MTKISVLVESIEIVNGSTKRQQVLMSQDELNNIDSTIQIICKNNKLEKTSAKDLKLSHVVKFYLDGKQLKQFFAKRVEMILAKRLSIPKDNSIEISITQLE